MNRLYFAYGSNLCLPRMRHRVPGVRKVGHGRLGGYALRWHKRGSDGSGKCSIDEVGGEAVVHGALYDVSAGERPVLDRIEGLGVGYREAEVRVVPSVAMEFGAERGPTTRGGSGSRGDAPGRLAWTYVATDTHVDDTLSPFRWYRALVLAGATALGFPSAYLAAIRSVDAVPDPDIRRASKNLRFLTPGVDGLGESAVDPESLGRSASS